MQLHAEFLLKQKHEILVTPGVIFWGLSGAEPPVKISIYFGTAQPHLNSCIGLDFLSLVALLPKCYDQLWSAIWLLRHLLLLFILYQY